MWLALILNWMLLVSTTPRHSTTAQYALLRVNQNFTSLLPYHGEGNGTPLQCSCLDNPRDGGAWWAAVSGVARSWTRLSNFTFTVHFHALEKEMATHSSVLAWRIPGKGEPGGLPSLRSRRVGHDWGDFSSSITLSTDRQIASNSSPNNLPNSCFYASSGIFLII